MGPSVADISKAMSTATANNESQQQQPYTAKNYINDDYIDRGGRESQVSNHQSSLGGGHYYQ